MADPILAPVEHDPWDPDSWNVPQGSSKPVHLMSALGNALMQTWKGNAQGIAGPVANLATLPGDVYTGKQSLATPEGQRRVQEAAMTMMGGGSAPEGAVASGAPFLKKLAELSKPKSNPLDMLEAELAGKTSPDHQAWLKSLEEEAKGLEKVQKPFMGAPMDHPAVGALPEKYQRPAAEILQMIKEKPEFYSSPKDASDFLVHNGYLEPEENDIYNYAGEKLQQHEDEHGKFNFAQNPPMEVAPKGAPKGWASTDLPTDPLAGLKHPLDYDKGQVKSPEEALYPINWNDLASTQPGPNLTATSGEAAERFQRARTQEYNLNLPLYHGSMHGLPESNVLQQPSMYKSGSEPAFFGSDTPLISNAYAGDEYTPGPGQNFPFVANPKNVLAVHWPEVAGNEGYSGSVMNKVLEAAQRKGAEAVVIHGIKDVATGAVYRVPQTQYAFLNTNRIKSPWAEFDPAYAESGNVIKSGGSPLLIPVNHDPFEAQNER